MQRGERKRVTKMGRKSREGRMEKEETERTGCSKGRIPLSDVEWGTGELRTQAWNLKCFLGA